MSPEIQFKTAFEHYPKPHRSTYSKVNVSLEDIRIWKIESRSSPARWFLLFDLPNNLRKF